MHTRIPLVRIFHTIGRSQVSLVRTAIQSTLALSCIMSDKISNSDVIPTSIVSEKRTDATTSSVVANSRNKTTDAGVIIIGNEILKGHIKDINAYFLLNRLWVNGVSVHKVSFIPDDVDKIAKEVAEFSEKYDFVITAGGIGPTHDDMTYEGIAKALKETLVVNVDLKNILEKLPSKKSLSNSIEKMTLLPESTKLIIGIDPITNKPVHYPLVCVKNVYIFPGVPEYLQKSFIINEHVFSGKSKFLLTKVYFSIEEEEIASCLENVNDTFKNVQVGSYPMLNDMYKVEVTLESQDAESTNNAYNALIKMLPKDVIVSARKYLPNSREQHHEIFNTSSSRILSTSNCKFYAT